MATNSAGSKGQQYHTKQVHFLEKEITYADNGTAKTLGYLPPGAVVLEAGCVVTTAFNAGTTNTLNMGTDADDDGFASLIALGTIGRIAADDMATSNDLYSTSERTITATVVLTGTAASAGAGIAYCTYIIPASAR